MRAPCRLYPVLAVLLALAACKEEKDKSPLVRPVLSVVVAPQTGKPLGFSGTIEPQYRAILGFRVLGRLIVRHANVGDLVHKGALLAALDPVALELAVRSAAADHSNALAQLANATATETRQRILLEQKTTTEAQFEQAQQAREAAAAAVVRARASLAKAQEQLSYAELRSDFDGVVTAVEAEVGQTVAAGQAVITVARPDIREAVIDVPEDTDGDLRAGSRFDVASQIDPSIQATGRVREIAPQADPATRSRRVRITLDSPPANLRLGTTVTATLTTPPAPRIVVPASALLERDGKTMVWVVDAASSTVSTREVRLGERNARAVQIADGLAPGTRVVTAGVNSLTPGQSVKLADGASR
jgi:membrane fusion protein, multidrug efflux system